MPKTPECKDMLEERGWTRRFIACEPRLSEAVKLYQESGFDVLLVNLASEEKISGCTKIENHDTCRECYNDSEKQYRIIYTRTKSSPLPKKKY